MFWASGDIEHRRGHGRVCSKTSQCCHHSSKLVLTWAPWSEPALSRPDSPRRRSSGSGRGAHCPPPSLRTPPSSAVTRDNYCLCNIWMQFVLSCRTSPGWLTACVVVMIVTMSRDVTLGQWPVSGALLASLLTLTTWGQTHNVMSAIQCAPIRGPDHSHLTNRDERDLIFSANFPWL